MASGYIHISRKDIVFDNDNHVVYWKNGARYLGEIAKAVLNEGEENETVKYYLKSAVTKKAILIDAGVIVGGGLYYFVTDDANFINVRIETADFSSDGGGDGVTVTFLLPESKYYTVRYVEENGDIKLFDVDGDAGTLIPDALPDVTDAATGDALILDADKKPMWAPTATKYIHIVKIELSNNGLYYVAMIVNDTPTPFTLDTYKTYLDTYASVNTPILANGYQGGSASNTKTLIDSIIGKSGSNYIYHGTKINLVDSTITPNETTTVPLGQLTSIHDTVY